MVFISASSRVLDWTSRYAKRVLSVRSRWKERVLKDIICHQQCSR